MDLSDDWSDQETDNPLRADKRNFYKLEKWTKDGAKIDRMLYAGNNLDKARKLFAEAIKHRPRIRLTIRRRTRVPQQWPAPYVRLVFHRCDGDHCGLTPLAEGCWQEASKVTG